MNLSSKLLSPGDEEKAARAPARPSLRARLRAETRSLHAQLDGSFEGLGAGSSLSAYPLFLQVNEACHRVLEPMIRKSGLWRHLAAVEDSPRHQAAAADLAALSLAPLVLPPLSIEHPDLAAGVGLAYVLEGARLGGRMILKRIGDAPGMENSAGTPTSFLESGADVSRFRQIMDAAEGLLPSTGEQDRAIAAANAAFGYFLTAVHMASTAPNSATAK